MAIFLSGNSTSILHEQRAANPSCGVAVFVAGNAGRPGGNVGDVDAKDRARVDRVRVHATASSEENVVSNWLMTTDPSGNDWDNLFRDNIGWPRWGLCIPKTTAYAVPPPIVEGDDSGR